MFDKKGWKNRSLSCFSLPMIHMILKKKEKAMKKHMVVVVDDDMMGVGLWKIINDEINEDDENYRR